jgi:quercetin dioxygenase-like cupin family protein
MVTAVGRPHRGWHRNSAQFTFWNNAAELRRRQCTGCAWLDMLQALFAIAAHPSRSFPTRVNSHQALPEHHLPGLEHQTLAGSKDGLRSFEIWRQTIAPRAATPVHSHDCEEVITVLRGRAVYH